MTVVSRSARHFFIFNYRLACMAGNGKGANVAHVENLSK